MASPVKSALAPSAVSLTTRIWCSPFEPDALPPTQQLTLGQRKVLQACVQLFADQGFAGSSIRDIAAAAGLQSASLYNHFPSKDAMLSALMVMGHEFHLDQVLGAVLSAPSDPRQQLIALVRAHVTVHCEFPKLGLIVNREGRFLPVELRPQIESIALRSAGITRDILRRGAERDVFELVGQQATILALASMGVDAARWFPYQSEISVDQLARDYAQLALRMVAT